MGLFDFGNKRLHHRAGFSFPGELEAVLIPAAADESEDPAKLLDTSYGGCALYVSPGIAARYPTGARAHVRFTRAREGDTQLMAVELVRRGEQSDGVLLELRFVRPESFASRLSTPWWRYFNRRESLRVPCSGEQAVDVRLVGGGLSLELGLANLSVDGFGVSLSDGERGRLVPGADVRAALSLKRRSKPLRFLARVAHVTPGDRRVLVGCAFDARKTSEFPAQQDVVSRWAGAWQRAQIARKDE